MYKKELSEECIGSQSLPCSTLVMGCVVWSSPFPGEQQQEVTLFSSQESTNFFLQDFPHRVIHRGFRLGFVTSQRLLIGEGRPSQKNPPTVDLLRKPLASHESGAGCGQRQRVYLYCFRQLRTYLTTCSQMLLVSGCSPSRCLLFPFGQSFSFKSLGSYILFSLPLLHTTFPAFFFFCMYQSKSVTLLHQQMVADKRLKGKREFTVSRTVYQPLFFPAHSLLPLSSLSFCCSCLQELPEITSRQCGCILLYCQESQRQDYGRFRFHIWAWVQKIPEISEALKLPFGF